MYYVLASRGFREAAMEKDGKLFFSFGPEMVHQVRTRDLQPLFRGSYEIMVNRGRYTVYSPPLEIEKVEDWPAAVREYEERIKAVSGS